jgi:hypothetical protein
MSNESFDTLSSRIAAATKLIFGQKLWLIVLHESKKPVAASAPFFVRLFRELLLSVLHDGILLRDAAGCGLPVR